jgi:hypothetical protein
MKMLTKKVVLAFAAAASIFAVSAASACDQPYRTYYLDRGCNIYYYDVYGNRVMEGRYSRDGFVGLTLQKDCCSGRWFYEDLIGNKFYVSKRCG